MSIISDHWNKISDKDWKDLAEKYLLEIRENIGKEFKEENHKYGLIVTEFQFSSSPELQWKFILIAISLAQTNEELAEIAAGGLEHLLGWHGEKYIKLVEKEARINPKFAKTLTGVWKYMMTDKIWEIVQKLQLSAKEKLH